MDKHSCGLIFLNIQGWDVKKKTQILKIKKKSNFCDGCGVNCHRNCKSF